MTFHTGSQFFGVLLRFLPRAPSGSESHHFSLFHFVHTGLVWADYSYVQPATAMGYVSRGPAQAFRFARNGDTSALDRNFFDLSRCTRSRPHATAHNGAELMLKELVLLFLIVFAGTGGELCVTRAMKKIGEVKDFRPASLVQTIFRVLGVGWMWLGVALMALAFFSILGMFSLESVSFVVPVTA